MKKLSLLIFKCIELLPPKRSIENVIQSRKWIQ